MQPTSQSLLREKTQLMSASEIERTLVRLAHQIIETNNGTEQLVLVGIKRRGVPLAQRLVRLLERIENRKVPLGNLDITLYRDDLSTIDSTPVVHKADIGAAVSGQKVILVDDVLYTGRTTRAALDALFDQGRPARVQLLVLIDRGRRELPIEATFVGREVQTSRARDHRSQIAGNRWHRKGSAGGEGRAKPDSRGAVRIKK